MKFKKGDRVLVNREAHRLCNVTTAIQGKVVSIDKIDYKDKGEPYGTAGNPAGQDNCYWHLESELTLCESYDSSVGKELMRQVEL